MKNKIWDLYAPIYELFMKQDRKMYAFMEKRVPEVIKDKVVLEIACGPGTLAKKIAHVSKKMVASDYSEGMLKEAKKGKYPSQLSFVQADAMNLSFEDESFDVIIITNALHLVPDKTKVMEEVSRVLKKKGILIAGNFVEHHDHNTSSLWTKLLKMAGICFETQWTKEEFMSFLEENGWKIINQKTIKVRIPQYTECIRKEKVDS